MGILLLNCILSGAALTKFSVTEETRSAAKRYCDRMEITRENSIYEGYTPLETANGDGSRCDQFVLTEDGVSVTEKMAAKKFYVLSDSYKGRYAGEREKYVFENAVYDRLEKSYELIYRLKGARIDKSGYALKNIFLSIKYLLRHQEYTGGEILIYDLDPELIRITPAEKPGYALALEDNNKKKGGNIILSDRNAGSFAVYRKENRYISIICAETDMALDVTGGVFREGTNVEQWEVTGGRPQEWEIVDGDGCVYLLSSDNMALTYEKDNNVCIKKFEGTAAQRWRMMDAD